MRFKKLLLALRPDVGISNERSRERWLEATLAAVPAGSRILDAGAGTQRYRRFCAHLNYVSQDFGEYDGSGDNAGLQTGDFDYGALDLVCDIASIPEADASFDAIMCVEVLEHVPHPELAIREFARLLRPGGRLIVTAPFCSLTHFAPYHFCTGFSRYWYEHHMKEHGLRIDELTPNGNYFEFLAQEMYRIPSIASRYSKSRPGPFALLSMALLLRTLKRLSRRDTNSSETLCYGFHVVARKCESAATGESPREAPR
ncbi:MAG: methyltransferase domain-containing protein [Phycisphaerae bacterium]|nr:methyltransferase domain-containing protein [Phycisphaerae bacterium]